MASLYVKEQPPVDMNWNTEWFMYPGERALYNPIFFFAWLLDMNNLLSCYLNKQWSYFQVTCHSFHWKKGTLFAEDQGMYNGLT
ncbi:hypothetical protein GQ457_06G031300 [Hibiscus cannabinus]